MQPLVFTTRVVCCGGLLLAALAACSSPKGERPLPEPESTESSAPPERPPATASPAGAIERPAPTVAQVQQAHDYLDTHVRRILLGTRSPWAVAHGVLAFGPDVLTAGDQKAAALLFAHAQKEPDTGRLGFPREHAGQLVEPHPHMIARVLQLRGLPSERTFAIRDGSPASLSELLRSTNTGMELPADDRAWRSAAWWLDLLALQHQGGRPPRLPPGVTSEELLRAAWSRLEEDHRVVAGARASANAFAPDTAIGAAKRGKQGIYAHACGGFHFLHAVLRLTVRTGDAASRDRIAQQLGWLRDRTGAEAALYGQLLNVSADARERITGQQLKYFGHLLEVVTWLEAAADLRDDERQLAEALRTQALAELVAAVQRLEQSRAYERLEQTARGAPQLALDLVGDGCHALRGLQRLTP